jgi:hypothetical protein
MIKPWSQWVKFIDRREGGEAMAALRLSLGSAALYATLHNYSVAHLVWVDAEHGGYRRLPRVTGMVEWLGGATPDVVSGLLAVTLVSALLLVFGILPRAAALVYLQTHMALSDLNGHAGGSYDELLSNCMWLMVFARSHATWSVTCRLRTGRWSDPDARVMSWPRYLVVLQLVLVYASTGFQKVSSHWIPGGDLGALYYILQQPSWSRWPDMTWLAWVYPVTQLMTFGVWLFELGAPLLLLALWARSSRTTAGPMRRWLNRIRYRDLFAFLGIGMHIGIHALMSVGPFSIISLAMYPSLWHADEWRRLSLRLSAWRPKPASPTPSAKTARQEG